MFISPLTLVSRHHAKQGVVSLTKESFFYFLTSKNGILLHKWKTSLFYVNLTAIDKSFYILVHLSKKEPHKEQMYFKLSVYCIGWIEMLLCPLFGSHKIPVRSDLYITSFFNTYRVAGQVFWYFEKVETVANSCQQLQLQGGTYKWKYENLRSLVY